MRRIIAAVPVILAATAAAPPAKPPAPETVTCGDGFAFQIVGKRDANYVLQSPVTLILPGQKPQTLVRDPKSFVGEDSFVNADWTYFEHRMTRGLENRRDRNLSHDCPP